MTKYIDTTKTEVEQPEPKKTVFTHYLNPELGNIVTTASPEHFEIVKYLGECKIKGQMFQGITKSGHSSIYIGFKGDEFNG